MGRVKLQWGEELTFEELEVVFPISDELRRD